ncbi:MAG: hypothetical protein V2A78_05110 [bacterium]
MLIMVLKWLAGGGILLLLLAVFYRRIKKPSFRTLLSCVMGGVIGLLAGLIVSTVFMPFIGLGRGSSSGWTGFSVNYIFYALFVGIGSMTALVGVFIGLAIGRKTL